jgi:hypothetical protein
MISKIFDSLKVAQEEIGEEMKRVSTESEVLALTDALKYIVRAIHQIEQFNEM